MLQKYSAGFTTAFAEQLAEKTRAEIGLKIFDRLDPLKLANYLEVPALRLSDLPYFALPADLQRSVGATQELLKVKSAFSAVTIFIGTKRYILHNDGQSTERQAANICHELAHGLLLHPPAPALTAVGLRDYQEQIENEATYLGAALLILGKAARGAGTRNMTVTDVAATYGTSIELARWRLNTTGYRKKMK